MKNLFLLTLIISSILFYSTMYQLNELQDPSSAFVTGVLTIITLGVTVMFKHFYQRGQTFYYN